MIPSTQPPSETEVRKHFESILRSDTFRKSNDPKSILSYLVDQALKGQHVTGMDIAVEVFHKHDSVTEARVKTAARNLEGKLREYYDGDGAREPIRIVFPKRGFVPTFKWSQVPSVDSIARLPPGNKVTRLTGAMRESVTEFGFVMAGLSEIVSTPQTSIDAKRCRQRFRQVFEPAFSKLRAPHSDYLKMFHAARSSVRRRIEPTIVEAILEELAQRRIALEAVRMELQFLFSQLSEEPLEPHARRFVEISLEYVQPPSKGTRAFRLIDLLRASAERARDDVHLRDTVQGVIDEEIRHLRALIRLITKEFVSLRLATWHS